MQPFISSQVKPPLPDHPALEATPKSPERLARQEAFFQGGAPLDPRVKAATLGPSGPLFDVGRLDLRASAFPLWVFPMAAGQRVAVQTRGLSPGGDSVVHLLWKETNREVAFDDDGAPEAGASMFSYTAEHQGTYVILIRAYATEDDGTCDLLVDGAVVLRGVPFGGSSVPVYPGRTLQAVLLNDGQGEDPWPPAGRAATDTLLLMVEAQTGSLLSLDDDSGVELGSALQVGPGQVVAILGAPHPAAAGSARLVFNDVAGGDTDGDGLGDRLEEALCLCNGQLREACGFNCTGEVNPQDTDGDGISDGEEVLGAHRPGFPQLFPRWGADPRHKDLWVEIDLAHWEDDTSAPPVIHHGRTLTAKEAHDAARVFGQLTRMENPDGQAGIRLHLDVGHACGTGSSGIDEVCGDLCAYDQEGRRRCGQSSYRGRATSRLDNLSRQRRHLFHVAVADCLVSGQAPGAPADHLEYDCNRWSALVHELGHNFGLAHYGARETGGGNCKPNYPSLMNYAYSDRFNGGRQIQFSSGSLIGVGDLDPLAGIDETAPFGGDLDVGWLAARPFYYDLYDCDSDGLGCKVDFNRDGRLDPSVRAHLSPMPGYGFICEGDHGNAWGSENVEDLQASGGPAAVEMLRHQPPGSSERVLYLMAPVRHEDGAQLWLNYTPQQAGAWEGWRSLEAGPLRKDTQPAALLRRFGDKEKSWIFVTAAGPAPIRVLELDEAGEISEPTVVPGQPVGLQARDVSVAEVGDDLWLVVRDDSPAGGDLVYATQHTAAGWSESFTSLMVEGRALRSLVTPALTAAPDGRVYLVSADPDPLPTTGPPGRLHLFGGAAGTSWYQFDDLELEGLRFEDGQAGHQHELWARPAMVFVPHLDGAGQPLDQGRGYLALWWNRGTRTRYLWTWGRLDQHHADFTLGRWQHYEAYGYTDAVAGSSPALVVRQGGKLSAFISQSERFAGLVRHVPNADGVPDVPSADTPGRSLVLRDHDDHIPLRENLCWSLNWDCSARCQDLNAPCEGETKTTHPEEVHCLLPHSVLDDEVP